MYENKSFLSIIPARAGSKRLPRKNILNLYGKPLIAWSILAGLKSKYIDEVLVSTDSEEIANISKKYHASVPFLRPQHLACDYSSTIDVIIHSINFYKEKFCKEFNYIILLQATSPLRDNTDIDKAIEFIMKQKADAIISVCEDEHNPLWTNVLPSNLSMNNFLRKEIINKNSQELPIFYRLNGAIYICKTENLLKEKTFFIKKNIYAYIMDQKKSIDIDSYFDFKLAKILLKEKN